MANNLLDKSSIILTPTAYDNGKALCVKPSDGSGDFDFSRNSAATRVNAQGLVENVQILSSNLVQNGDFSEEGAEEVSNGSFSQEGSELIVNGDFTNGTTGWSSNATLTESNNIANITTTSPATVYIRQNAVYEFGKRYKLTFTAKVDNLTEFGLYVGSTNGYISTGIIPTQTTDFQEYNFYFQADTAGGMNLLLRQSMAANSSIEYSEISVREVGQDWALGAGWSIGEDKAVATNAPSGQSVSQNAVASQIPNGKTVKVSFEVTSISQGSFGIYFSGSLVGSLNSVGVGTFYFVKGTETSFYIRALGTTSGSVTNISVKEVGQNWDLVSANASIGENKLIANSIVTENIATQSGVVPISKPIILKFDLILNSGGFRVLAGSGGTATNITTSGTYTLYETSGTGGTLTLQSRFGSFDGSVTNLSIIEITTDTNLPRINYEGFSYQDAFGSEEVVNGGFDNGLSNWIKIGPGEETVVNGQLILRNTGRVRQDNVVSLTKTYKGEITISGLTTGSLDFYIGSSEALTINSNGVHTFQVSNPTDPKIYIYDNGDGWNGYVDNVSVKEVTGQEVVPDSGCGSWLLEPQSTNLIEYSENFSGNWLVDDVTISSDLTISPSGESYSPIMVVNTVASRHNIKRTKAGVNTATLSIFAKARELSYIQIASANSTTQFANFDLSNGTIGSVGSSFSDAKIEDYGNGWYRCSAVSDNQYNQAIFSLVTSATSPWLQSWTSANNTDGLYIWGAMLDENSFITSYIPTSGSTVTRNQDVCTNGGSLATINSTEGVLYAEIAALADGVGTRTISVSDGTNNNSITLRYTTNAGIVNAFIVAGGFIQFSANISGVSVLDFNKVAIKYSLNNMALWINGVEVATDTSGTMPLGLNEINFTRGDGANKFFGKTKALAVWKEALSDSELQSLTTI